MRQGPRTPSRFPILTLLLVGSSAALVACGADDNGALADGTEESGALDLTAVTEVMDAEGGSLGSVAFPVDIKTHPIERCNSRSFCWSGKAYLFSKTPFSAAGLLKAGK